MTSSQTPVPISTLLAHREWVRRLARSLVRDDASADDVEQRTWLTALRSPPRDAGRARAWLARVVRNQALDSFRAEGRRDVHERTAARADSVRPAADVVAEAESQKRVVVAVCGLAEPYRTTMLLRFYEDLPPRDVAARMDVPVETVRTRIRRGGELVRAQLGGDRSAWLAALTPLATAKTAGGLVMKGSTKAAMVSMTVLAAVAGLGWFTVEMTDDDSGSATAAAPGSSAEASTDRAGAQPSPTPRNRSAEPAGDTANAVSAASPTAASSATAAPVVAAKTTVPPAEAAHASRAADVTSPPRPSGRSAPTPAPWTADELLDLLSKPAEPALPCSELADDGAAFARGFVLRKSGEIVDPLRADPKAALADGSHIVFPAGCHRWDTTPLSQASLLQGRAFPEDVVVEGAGMDSTLVVPTAQLVGRKVRGLTFRNLTIHCNDTALLGVDAGVVHLDHVRVVGFDSAEKHMTSQGQGQVFTGGALAVLAQDCRFESGFGSIPGRVSWLLGTSPAGSVQKGWLTIARFERCKFLGPLEKPTPGFSVFVTSPPGATVYSQCDLVDCAGADRATIEHPDQGPSGWAPTYLRFEDCRVSYAPASDGTPRKRRDVSELNPAWKMPEMAAPK